MVESCSSSVESVTVEKSSSYVLCAITNMAVSSLMQEPLLVNMCRSARVFVELFVYKAAV